MSPFNPAYPFGSHARPYHERGWFSIPCCWPTPAGQCWCGRNHLGRDIGKAPALPSYKGFFTRPPSQEQVSAWARLYPSANIASLLEPSRLFIVDLDSEEAEDKARQLGLPRTLLARTCHGLHAYYQRPERCPVTRATKLGASRHIDVLTHGYVVAPPSRHRTGITRTRRSTARR